MNPLFGEQVVGAVVGPGTYQFAESRLLSDFLLPSMYSQLSIRSSPEQGTSTVLHAASCFITESDSKYYVLNLTCAVPGPGFQFASRFEVDNVVLESI